MPNFRIVNYNNMFNTDTKINCFLSGLFYLILLFVVLYLITSIYHKFKLAYLSNPNENFESFLNVKSHQELNQELNQQLNQEQNQQLQMENLIKKNNELNNIKDKLKNVLDEQNKAIFLSQNYDKINSSSFDGKMDFFLTDFSNTNFPLVDIKDKKIIKTESELNNLLTKVSKMKNFYKPGEIVDAYSDFNIGPSDICYRDLKNKNVLMEQLPNCMVCSVKSMSNQPENVNNLINSKSWKNTKTNIDKVCLFNPNAENNSGVANLEQCQKFCNISNK